MARRPRAHGVRTRCLWRLPVIPRLTSRFCAIGLSHTGLNSSLMRMAPFVLRLRPLCLPVSFAWEPIPTPMAVFFASRLTCPMPASMRFPWARRVTALELPRQPAYLVSTRPILSTRTALTSAFLVRTRRHQTACSPLSK